MQLHRSQLTYNFALGADEMNSDFFCIPTTDHNLDVYGRPGTQVEIGSQFDSPTTHEYVTSPPGKVSNP